MHNKSMRTSYTSKLFYGKYPFKLAMAKEMSLQEYQSSTDWTIFNCKTWLNQSKIDYRIYSEIVTIKGRKKTNKSTVRIIANLYLKTDNDFNACLTKWKNEVIEVTKPYDISHIDLLKDNAIVVIRDRLIYGRFKYVITLKRTWDDNLTDLFSWIETSIENSPSSPMKLSKKGWRPRLYLSSADDMTLFKLTWSEYIKDITIICTINELNSAKN